VPPEHGLRDDRATREPKTRVEQLAVAGGAPAFADPLHVGRPNVGDRAVLAARIGDMLDRRWLTNGGVYVQEFERRIAEAAGVPHAVATSNGTAALEIAIRALGLHGEVIVPAFTFVATAHALAWQGITPVFADIDPRTHTIDPSHVERLITARTTGIIGVHVWGHACEVEALEDIARRHGIKLLFDAAHAFGCARRGRRIGGFGHAEVFSFHATKVLNSAEGGAIVTHDAGLAHAASLMRNFGFATYDQVDALGTNAKMSELSAALGLTNIESLESFVEVNARNDRQYRDELRGLDGITVLSHDRRDTSTRHYVVLDVDATHAGLSRDGLMAVLHAEQVLARRYFHPGCHRTEPYRSRPLQGPPLGATDEVTRRVLCLPTGTAVGSDDIRQIGAIIRLALAHADDVRRWAGL
jgi:dTDP-4-amino-4,6-dideoxygalactose transaminase